MAIFIDSVDEAEVKKGLSLGWLSGVTTNPLLISRSGINPNKLIKRLSKLNRGLFFYQLMAEDPEEMLLEAIFVGNIIGKYLVLKIPPTSTGFRFCSHHHKEFTCCITAIYSATQSLVARESGARYIATYVNRAENKIGNSIGMLKDIMYILQGSSVELIAASIKSADEARSVLLSGVHHLAVPYSVLVEMMNHPLSEEAINEFYLSGKGVNYSG